AADSIAREREQDARVRVRDEWIARDVAGDDVAAPRRGRLPLEERALPAPQAALRQAPAGVERNHTCAIVCSGQICWQSLACLNTAFLCCKTFQRPFKTNQTRIQTCVNRIREADRARRMKARRTRTARTRGPFSASRSGGGGSSGARAERRRRRHRR